MASLTAEMLIDFLNDMKEKISNNTINPVDLYKITQLYILNKFREVYIEPSKEISEEELEKYISLGWYIYTHMIETTF